MKETYVYHGHSIDLDLSATAGSQIRWTYFIDRHFCIQGVTDSSPIEAVRTNTIALAHRSIEVLDLMQTGTGNVQPSRATDLSLVATMMDHGSQRFAAGWSPDPTT